MPTNYLTTDTDLTSVANAIRTKGGTSAQLAFPSGFVSAINAISGGGGLTVIEVTLTQDYTETVNSVTPQVAIFNIIENAIGTDFFAFCMSSLPSGHTMADSENLIYCGAYLPALHVAPGSTIGKYYDISKKTFWRTYRQDAPQGPYTTNTNGKGLAGTKFKVWGWNVP